MGDLLGFDIARPRGRMSEPIAHDYMRDLTLEDLIADREARGQPCEGAQAVIKLRDRHHALAKCLASGMRPGDAAAVCGYSLSRVSILQNDPSFQDLIEVYRADANAVWRDTHERMASIANDAILELHDRLEAEPEKFDNDLLVEIGKTFADRTGHGPSSKVTNVDIKVNLGDRLLAARERAKLTRQATEEVGDVVDAEIVDAD